MDNGTIRRLVGTAITFDDGRNGIISGGCLAYGWARTLDGSIAHQYSWDAISRRIASGSPFPVAF